MIKRLSKFTSLMVAMTSITSLSMTGVNAAEYERIDYKEGSVYEAVTYKDGKFYIDGQLEELDNEGVYYLSDGKYTKLTDLDTGSEVEPYGAKYLNIDSGDIYLDLSSGESVDEDLEQDDIDDTKVNLRKNIRNKADDRYSDHDISRESLTKLKNYNFGEEWYETTFAPEQITNGDADELTVYTNKEGKYIDADYNVGKIKVVTDNKIATLNNTDDTEKNISVSVSNAKVITHDNSYIYRKATMTVKSDETINKINGIDIPKTSTDQSIFIMNEENNIISFDVIQKISKEQSSETIDGAKYAKNVTTYMLSKSNGTKVKFDVSDDTTYSISKGKIIACKINENGTISAQGISLKSEAGVNTVGIKKADAEEYSDYAIDVNGVLWRLDGGYIYRYNGATDWIKVYKVDGSMTRLSVYDENNMLVWDEEAERYSIINKAPKDNSQALSENIEKVENLIDGNVITGWIKNESGTWSFVNSDSSLIKGWLNDNSNWYYLDENGVMKTGWINDKDKWYYLNSNGSMATGWIKESNDWYYLKENGAMATGWVYVKDKWYYLNSNGSMVYNTTINGYRVGADGAMI